MGNRYSNPAGLQTQLFNGQVILITGGTSGIGLAAALAFVKADAAAVVVCGRSTSKWESAQHIIIKHLDDRVSRIHYRYCDVRLEQDVKDLINAVHTEFDRIDVFVNCAGVQPVNTGDITLMEFESLIGQDGSIMYRLPPPQPKSNCSSSLDTDASKTSVRCPSCPPTEITAASVYCENPIATSAIGIFYCLKHQVKYAFEKQASTLPVSIVSITSRNSIIPDSHRPLYAASKAFIVSLTKTVASAAAQRAFKEKRPSPVRVNAVAPGPVDTPLETAAFPGSYAVYEKAATKGVPMGRTAKPYEIAPSILFLSHPALSGYITGVNLPVDGGNVASPIVTSL